MPLARLIFILLLVTLPVSVHAMQIYIQLPSGSLFSLEAESSDSIQQVKQKIQDQLHIPPESQRLFIGETELEDGRTLYDHHIQPGQTLRLLLPVVASIPTLGIPVLIALAALLAVLGLRARRRAPAR